MDIEITMNPIQDNLVHRTDTVHFMKLDTISESKKKVVRKRVSNDLKVCSSAHKSNFVSEKHVPKISVACSSRASLESKPHNLRQGNGTLSCRRSSRKQQV